MGILGNADIIALNQDLAATRRPSPMIRATF